MKIENIKELMIKLATVQNKQAKVEFSFDNGESRQVDYEVLNDVLRGELDELAGDYNKFRRNKNTLFELMQQVIDVVLPINVWDSLEPFCEITTWSSNDKPYYKRRQSELRGRNFVTRVSNAGVYEAFRMDDEVFMIPTGAYGGAAQIGIEEFIQGRVDIAELLDIMNVGMEIAVYKEIMHHMKALITNNQLPANNIHNTNKWDPIAFNALLGVARAYAEPTVFCAQTFAATMNPSWQFTTDADRNEKRAKGYIGQYLGAKIVILPQTFYDINNEGGDNLAVPPGTAWIMPTGKDKPVKLAFQGDTIVKEFENRDFSTEIQCYKKFGVIMIAHPGICVYVDSSLNNWPNVESSISADSYTYVVN